MSQQLESFREAVAFVGGVIEATQEGGLQVILGDGHHDVGLLTAGAVFPRDAKMLVWSAMDIRSDGRVPVVVGEVVSEGARKFLREQQVGYSDAGGSLFLPLKGAFVLVDKAAPKREKRVVKSVLSGKTSLAVHALMTGDRPLKGVDISQMTGLSLGGVSAALDKLDRMGWLVTSSDGATKFRSIGDRRGLIEQWKLARLAEGPVRKERFYVPGVTGADALARKVSAVAAAEGIPYMVTGPYGAQVHAPYLSAISQVVCRIPEGDIERMAAALGARKVNDGWNLGLVPSDIPASPPFLSEVDGLMIASPLLCWVDTVAEVGRARELADHLASERIFASAS